MSSSLKANSVRLTVPLCSVSVGSSPSLLTRSIIKWLLPTQKVNNRQVEVQSRVNSVISS